MKIKCDQNYTEIQVLTTASFCLILDSQSGWSFIYVPQHNKNPGRTILSMYSSKRRRSSEDSGGSHERDTKYRLVHTDDSQRDKRDREDGSEGSSENPEKVRRVEVIEKHENAEMRRMKAQEEIKVDGRQKMKRGKKNKGVKQLLQAMAALL